MLRVGEIGDNDRDARKVVSPEGVQLSAADKETGQSACLQEICSVG
jgi:hypothetical protein